MSLLLVGDTHGNAKSLVDSFFIAQDSGATAIVQLGDYGYGWGVNQNGECLFAELTSELVQKVGIPFYFIDGNHENFTRLYAKPVDENGHRVVAEGVTHLQRGSLFHHEGAVYMAFGGAVSVDKGRRKIGKSLWLEEEVIEADLEFAKASGSAYVFLSHDAPYGAQTEQDYRWLGGAYGEMAVVESVANQKKVRQALNQSKAKYVFHGHLHRHYRKTLDNGVIVTGLNAENDKGSRYLLTVEERLDFTPVDV